ncbi:MAG: sigma 54-interacting transcriptional regulator [Acidobacteriota bacterium]|nr:sigma 54-interacting transcriptional regulator [Acidobacteriota bacterium]
MKPNKPRADEVRLPAAALAPFLAADVPDLDDRRQRSERPDVRDLVAYLSFSPMDGRIWLDQQRMLLLHSSSLGALRQELIDLVGLSTARAMLTRAGYASGVRDAELVRKRWPGDVDGAFTAGMRLHALEGIVKVSTVSAEFNIPHGTFQGEYLWHDSFEASEYVSAYGIGNEPACWMEVGYASGYASAFFGKLITYREVECMAMGSASCRVIGKPTDAWDNSEEDLRYLSPDVFARYASGHRARAAAEQNPPVASRQVAPPAPTPKGMVGISAAFSAARHMIERVAPTPATVLFIGESGVGKEIFAQALHGISPRSAGPFVAVNCAAVPDTLMESELFGVEKGAYTGASNSRAGRFERAAGGTIFLDEIPSLSLSAQGKLLRVLQEREFDRVGGIHPIKADVRVVAATNRDLREEIRAGRFREDLYYRLNVFPVHLPPLRSRRDDIPLLIEHFLGIYNQLYRKTAAGFNRRAVEALLNYDYPGNVRELQNIVERGVISAGNDGVIELHHLFSTEDMPRDSMFSLSVNGALSDTNIGAVAQGREPAVNKLLDDGDFSLIEHERQIYRTALARSGGNVSGAARLLGLTRAQLAYRMKNL